MVLFSVSFQSSDYQPHHFDKCFDAVRSVTVGISHHHLRKCVSLGSLLSANTASFFLVQPTQLHGRLRANRCIRRTLSAPCAAPTTLPPPPASSLQHLAPLVSDSISTFSAAYLVAHHLTSPLTFPGFSPPVPPYTSCRCRNRPPLCLALQAYPSLLYR